MSEGDKKKGKKKGGGAAAPPSLRDCANCGAPEGSVEGSPTHKPCGKCKITFYCSTKCQKHHWKTGGHKQNCVSPEERSVSKKESSASGGGGAAAAAAEDLCAICQGPLSESPSKPLPCSHVYHLACVEKLRSFAIKQACPMCRAELPPGPEKLYEDALLRWMVIDRRYGIVDGQPWREIRDQRDRREIKEAAQMLHEAADQGHSPAQAILAIMYQLGNGVAQNDATAAEWWLKAAAGGDIKAMANMGNRYREGRGVEKNYATAMEWYRKAAGDGNVGAIHMIGVMYQQGEGQPNGEQDFDKAVAWTRKAADLGSELSQLNLGALYYDGRSIGSAAASGQVPGRDVASAMKWYRKAADQGNAQAQYELGCMYQKGEAPDGQDLSEALRWLRKAQAQGHEKAGELIRQSREGKASPPIAKEKTVMAVMRFNALNNRYSQGDTAPWRKITDPDDQREAKKVAKLLRELADQPGAAALVLHLVACMYDFAQGRDQDLKLALKYYRKAADQGEVRALFAVGCAYGLGKGVATDPATALKWYRKAAAKGHKSSIFNVANAYKFGNGGTPQNHATAAQWYSKGVELGHAGSQYNLGCMCQQGEGVPQSHAKALDLYRKAAAQGHTSAMVNYGIMHAEGNGVPKNLSEGIRWLHKAQALGEPNAAGMIQQLLQSQREEKAAAAAAAASAALPIPLGAIVELHGLKGKPELNGRIGITDTFDAASGRYLVHVEKGGGAEGTKPFKLLPDNLTEMMEPPEEGGGLSPDDAAAAATLGVD